ncbi:MAG: metallopeptidase family protein [Opitutales bacterium]
MPYAAWCRQAEQVVAAIQKQLPAEIRPLAAAVPVLFERRPDAELQAEGFEPDILGLFTGQPYGTEFSEDQTALPRIVLYLDNMREAAEGDPAVFRDEVRLTYLHELGHYLGWDEDDLAARGLD